METTMTATLKARELALQLGLSEQTLANWRATRRGPRFVKVGSAVRYLESDIAAWLAANTHEGDDSGAAA
jgi:predicted DNA-binding transcriptional regulator AlpA